MLAERLAHGDGIAEAPQSKFWIENLQWVYFIHGGKDLCPAQPHLDVQVADDPCNLRPREGMASATTLQDMSHVD